MASGLGGQPALGKHLTAPGMQNHRYIRLASKVHITLSLSRRISLTILELILPEILATNKTAKSNRLVRP